MDVLPSYQPGSETSRRHQILPGESRCRPAPFLDKDHVPQLKHQGRPHLPGIVLATIEMGTYPLRIELRIKDALPA